VDDGVSALTIGCQTDHLRPEDVLTDPSPAPGIGDAQRFTSTNSTLSAPPQQLEPRPPGRHHPTTASLWRKAPSSPSSWKAPRFRTTAEFFKPMGGLQGAAAAPCTQGLWLQLSSYTRHSPGMGLHQHDLWHGFDSGHPALCQVIPSHSLGDTTG